MGLWFRISGLGFRALDWDLRLRVYSLGLGFSIYVLQLGIEGLSGFHQV